MGKNSYPEFRIERRISIAKQVLEKSFEVEAAAVEQCEMLELMEVANPVDVCLRILQRGVLLLLHLHHESPQLLHGHEPVRRRVLEEYCLHVIRCLCRCHPEPPLEAEAHPVRLFARHLAQFFLLIRSRRLLGEKGRGCLDLIQKIKRLLYGNGRCGICRHRGGLATDSTLPSAFSEGFIVVAMLHYLHFKFNLLAASDVINHAKNSFS